MIPLELIQAELAAEAKFYKCVKKVNAVWKSNPSDWTEAYFVIDEAKQKKQAREAAYRVKNKDKIAAKDAAYRAKNKDKIAAKDAAYYAANKDKRAARKAANYTKNKNLAEKSHGTHCQICGSTDYVDWAHVEGNKTKVKDVTDFYNLSTPDAWQFEAKKCVRLCRSCHRGYDGNWAKDHGQSWPSLNKFSEAIRAKKV